MLINMAIQEDTSDYLGVVLDLDNIKFYLTPVVWENKSISAQSYWRTGDG